LWSPPGIITASAVFLLPAASFDGPEHLKHLKSLFDLSVTIHVFSFAILPQRLNKEKKRNGFQMKIWICTSKCSQDKTIDISNRFWHYRVDCIFCLSNSTST
jgi:hypothetical protein